MKIIVSHDVDHITSYEHLSDTFLLKFMLRNIAEFYKSNITFLEFNKRLLSILNNKFNNIEDLVLFDNEHSVNPTFFIAVNKALSLSYNPKHSKKKAEFILNNGIQVGIHGINFDTQNGIKEEKEIFKELFDHYPSGIRMHYLRTNERTLENIVQAGYLFDSTISLLRNPYKTGNLWEFPVHLMDSVIVYGDSKYQSKSLEQMKRETIQCIEMAEELKIEYFTIDSHDFYFSDAFKSWKNWYIWLIEYFQSNNYKFINFENAIIELDHQMSR